MLDEGLRRLAPPEGAREGRGPAVRHRLGRPRGQLRPPRAVDRHGGGRPGRASWCCRRCSPAASRWPPERVAEAPGGPSGGFLLEEALATGSGSRARSPSGPGGRRPARSTPSCWRDRDGDAPRYRKIHPFSLRRRGPALRRRRAPRHGQRGGPPLARSSSATTCASPTSSGPPPRPPTATSWWPTGPSKRRHHWTALLLARAIENQAYVVGVNRVGTGDGLVYAGDSRIVDPWGEELAAAAGQETLLLADLDPAAWPTPARPSPSCATADSRLRPQDPDVSAAVESPIFALVEAHMMETSAAMLDPETSWTAVLARDARYDGRFVYAVRSTGVFCRPTLPLAAARACAGHVLRDAPGRAGGGLPGLPALSSRGNGRASGPGGRRARARAHRRPSRRASHPARPGPGGRSQPHPPPALLQGRARALAREYVKAMRTERFKSEVRAGRSVTDALYEAGYGSGSRLYEDAADRLGMTPGAYKRGGAGQLIRYTTTASVLGRLLVAATERGVCAVQIADSDAALEKGLRHDYPRRRPAARREGAARDRGRHPRPPRGRGSGVSTCPSTSPAPTSRGRSGARCRTSRGERRAPTPRSPRRWAGRARCGRWPARAPPTAWPCSSPATGWCAATGRAAGTAGEWAASSGSWRQEQEPRRKAGPARGGTLTSRRASRGSTGRGWRRTWARGPTPVSALCSRPASAPTSSALYGDDRRFRSTVDMGRHRFGMGEYKYFARPLPPLVNDLRTLGYERLAPIANGWTALRGRPVSTPSSPGLPSPARSRLPRPAP